MLKLGMGNCRLKLYKVYINDDPGFTMTYFTARSILVSYMYLNGKTITKSIIGEKNFHQMTKLTEDLFL